MRRIVLLATLLLLAGCAGPIDGEQVRVCEAVVPALHPDGTTITEVKVSRARLGRQGVRIDYRAREPGAASQAHWAACGFAGSALMRGRLDLVAVDTDAGALGEARLLYLRRFWLSGPGALPSNTPAIAPGVPQVPPAVAYAVQQVINAVALCAIYALLAAAYALIYGLIGRINLAFGDIAVIGAYGAVGGAAIAIGFGIDDPIGGLAVAFALAAALSALWSVVVGRVIIAPLHGRYRTSQPILVATIGAAIAIQEFLRLTQGARDRWLPPLFSEPVVLARAGNFVVTVTAFQIAAAAIAVAVTIGVMVALSRTRFGREWRAFADDPQAAALMGVAPTRVFAGTFALAGLMAGLGGWIIAAYYGNVSFAMGTMLGLKALIAAVVGGIGSVPGAFLGGVLVGLLEAFWSAYFDLGWRDIVVFAVLAVVFIVRPGGLLGISGPSPRDV